jgi:hypothetical protein
MPRLISKYKNLLTMAISTEELEPTYETPYRGTEDMADRRSPRMDKAPIGSRSGWISPQARETLECWYKVPSEVFLSITTSPERLGNSILPY